MGIRIIYVDVEAIPLSEKITGFRVLFSVDIIFCFFNKKKHFLFCQFAQNLGQGHSFPFISSLD